MRAVVAGAMAASVSTVALADVTPPASVWKAAADGGYEHVLTGLQCPATLVIR
jgi:hypothetical protein